MLGRKISDALRDLVPFVLFKKPEKNHGGVLHLVKLEVSAFLHVFFSRFLNYANVTKSLKVLHMKAYMGFSDDFKGNRSKLIHLNSLKFGGET